MFQNLQQKLDSAFSALRGKTSITEKDIDNTMRSVRMALLEADVNFKVAKDFCTRVGTQAKGEKVLKSLTPDQQIIKIVHQELVETVGDSASPLITNVAPPVVILLVGLQGAGKTTTCSKLGRLLTKEYKKKTLLVPADVYRPAAIEQLKTLGKSQNIEVFDSSSTQNPVDIAKEALSKAKGELFDAVIIDTAGRLQIDDALMDELENIKSAVSPTEILLVADAMTGQAAVDVAKGFDGKLGISGLILTKLDGDARGGAALSMRAVTQKPIKFVGVSEKPDGLEIFHPERMATRILGMGDVMTLIEKAQKQISADDAKAMQKKMRKNEFDLNDFIQQLQMMKKMGSMQSIMGMIPGMSKLSSQIDMDQAEKQTSRIEAIILSMTQFERKNHSRIDGSRRKRIAAGSGTTVQEVNQLLKQFVQMRKVMKKLNKGGMGNIMKMMRGMKMPGGFPGM